jgi:capsular polysaccharide biosynthesis protein
MPDSFDAYQYLAHLRARWRLTAIVSGSAVLAALVGSLLISKKYTASVSLVIDLPAGSDARASATVSPIYLESLKTYEHLASSDQLFAQAAERFELRRESPRRSLESLKRSVLKVSIPRNTKVLQISVTLPDRQKAHDLALDLAQETMRLNRLTNRAGDDELIVAARKRVEEAVARTKAAEAARARAAPGASRFELETLDSDVQSAWVAQDEQERRLRDLEATAGYRGERLTLLDPGFVPERPSSPNVPLNVVAALALALTACWLYLTLEYGLRPRPAEPARPALRVASKT